MSIKIIMAPLSGVEGGDASLETALHVAKHFGTHVEAFHASIDSRDSVAYLAEGMTSAMIQDIMDAVEKESGDRTTRARAQFDAACRRAGATVTTGPSAIGFSASFNAASGREEDLIALRGRLCDLIVAGRREDDDGAARGILEIALLETGRPVLVAPPRPALDFGRVVGVAWNGSAEAARAIASGLPFLRGAEEVIVLVVPEGARSGPPLDQLIAYLGCHGVKATARHIEASDKGVGKEILSQAEAAGIDLLVMGAYTHSRLRHLIFGGATSAVLDHTNIPVLMAH
ncbi:MAG: universal stress protein [Proteobacteria bacterium]|nr:universal stress protein [Pseudomonadota bacterium]